jgi:hypothetical protein
MNYFTDADVAFLKMDQSHFIPTTAKQYRPANVNGPLGQTQTINFVKDLKCRIAPIGDRRSETVYQFETNLDVQRADYTHIGTFESGSNILLDDIIEANGRSFKVVARLTRSSYETAERVYLNENI